MEHFWNWLGVFMNKAHIPFIAGLYINSKHQENNNCLDLGDIGDNVPHVFFITQQHHLEK